MKFAPGDVAPWFVAPTQTTAQFHFSAAAGRYVVLSFLGSASNVAVADYVAAVCDDGGRFDDENRCFFGVSVDSSDFSDGRLRERIPGIRFFVDIEAAVCRSYGALVSDESGKKRIRPFTLVLDPRLHVIECLRLQGSGQEHAAAVFRLLDALPDLGTSCEGRLQAPVLMVPRVFEPALCERLIAYYEEHGGEESGFMRDVGGKTVGIYEFATKRRQDCTIEDESLRRLCAARIKDRLAPELLRAYQFNATRMERYIVARYRGDQGGHFRAHRDNTTTATAHRKFAVSVNLNSGYEGGHVWFPEYGRQLFRPGPGEACVFSCSLLHEATPVRSGVRYVFLPFLYDDVAADLRRETEQYLGGDVNDRPPPS